MAVEEDSIENLKYWMECQYEQHSKLYQKKKICNFPIKSCIILAVLR